MQLVSGPPVWVEDTAVIVLLKVRVNGAPANAKALGATSLTVKVTEAVLDPPELPYVMVAAVAACSAVGVPERRHSPEFTATLTPVGRFEPEQLVSGPPVWVEFTAVIALLIVRVKGAPAKANALGATSTTANETVAVFEPPELP